MGKSRSCRNICGIISLVYFVIVLLKIMLDVRWTSLARGLLTTQFWLAMPLYPFNDKLLRIFHVDQKHIPPGEPIPRVQYTRIQPGEDPVQVLIDASKTLDRIVVWKNFIGDSNGLLEKFQDEQYVKDTFNMSDVYDFMADYSNFEYARMPLEDAWPRMDTKQDLYLGFSYVLMRNNPEYQQAVYDAIDYHGEDLTKVTNLDFAIQHGFLYRGNRFSTGMHQAPVADWFIQIANSKVWRFVSPEYTPYIRPMAGSLRIGMISGYSYLPNDTNIPYVDVETAAGDLMYFPPHWWHEVHNVHDDAFGLACGFRPKETLFPLKWLSMPWTAPKGQIMHKLGIIPGFVFANILYDTVFNRARGSGVEDRKARMIAGRADFQNYWGDWTWDKWAMKEDNLYAKPFGPDEVHRWKSEL